MELQIPDRVHPILEVGALERLFGALDADVIGGVSTVASPYHIFAAETLRDAHDLRVEPSIPADFFVFGQGAPPRRDCTLLGGLPYWPKALAWPHDAAGRPCRFLGQFNFSDSEDLVGSLPGAILTIFLPHMETADVDWIWDSTLIQFIWQAPTADELIDALPKGAENWGPGQFYGVVHRSADYPSGDPEGDYGAAVLEATKIGGFPMPVQDMEPVPSGRFLCQIASVQAEHDVAFPFTNRSDPLTLQFDQSGIYGKENEVMFGDMGTICLFIEPDGTLNCVADSA